LPRGEERRAAGKEDGRGSADEFGVTTRTLYRRVFPAGELLADGKRIARSLVRAKI
jgi:hypothetical protein